MRFRVGFVQKKGPFPANRERPFTIERGEVVSKLFETGGPVADDDYYEDNQNCADHREKDCEVGRAQHI